MPETLAHLQLKRLAAATLLRWGCHAVATEVLCPISRYRVDAAGYLDAEPYGPDVNHVALRRGTETLFDAAQGAGAVTGGPRRSCPPRTVIIECKQSREDFLRDRDEVDKLLGVRASLQARLDRFVDTVKRTEPELCRTDGVLFGELGEWDLSGAANPTYRAIVRAMERVETRLHGGTKFGRLARWRLADRLYILAPPGVVRSREVPPGWGLIECARSWSKFRGATTAELTDFPVHISAEAPRLATPERRRARLLRNIAVALTRAAAR